MTPTLKDRLTAVLPCQWIDSQSCDADDPRRCEHCRMRPAILTLIRALLREERERCADVALRRVAPDSPDHVSADCVECHDGLMLVRDIRALGDRP